MSEEKVHTHVFTSESVSEGHPDKVADQISDAILDACLRRDPQAHVACETAVGPDIVINLGEIACQGFEGIDTEAIARRVVKRIGYTVPDEHFAAQTFKYENFLHGQSPDIAQGVNRKSRQKQGAGDQGMMFGYATNETRNFMPAAVVYSHELLKIFARLRRRGGRYNWLRPDAKTQLSVVYENGRPRRIDTVVISQQTTERGATKLNYEEVKRLACDYLSKTGLLDERTRFFVNPTGKFVVGGPCGDSGLTGRKIVVDTYGGMAAHGGGAFSGKDPTKVDRSAAYAARYVAKNIVAAGLADRCLVQLAYAIGVAEPVSILVDTQGTGTVDDSALEAAVSKVFDLRPTAIIRDLDLKKPIYRKLAAYGHMGREDLGVRWEQTDRVEALLSVLNA